MVKFDGAKEEVGPLLTIYDYIRIAGEGSVESKILSTDTLIRWSMSRCSG